MVRVRTGKTVTVTAGTATYEFDPASARLLSASNGAVKLITGSRFTIWRPLGANDVVLLRNRPADLDLNKYTTAVKSWKVTESASGVRIEAEAEHTVNEKNGFAVSYVYEVGRDGVLRVRYSVRPRVEIPWLPEIGMEFETAAGLDNLRWLGLGPLDAYPNEKSAPILGVYAGGAGSDTVKGTKSARWAEVSSDQRAGVPRGRLAIHPVGGTESARAAFGGGTFREEPPAGSSRIPSGHGRFGGIPGRLLRDLDSGREK